MVEVLAPGDDVSAGNQAQFDWCANAGKGHEFFEVISVCASRMWVVDVGKPLGFGRYILKLGEF